MYMSFSGWNRVTQYLNDIYYALHRWIIRKNWYQIFCAICVFPAFLCSHFSWYRLSSLILLKMFIAMILSNISKWFNLLFAVQTWVKYMKTTMMRMDSCILLTVGRTLSAVKNELVYIHLIIIIMLLGHLLVQLSPSSELTVTVYFVLLKIKTNSKKQEY